MAIAKQPQTGGGLQSVQDLYDMINGKETTVSGGSTTQTETSGFSQEAMNAMLQSALSNTNGLAAVSQGQRSAGGYNSTVNKMLTNDLMTRTAAQLAQLNQTKTSTKTSAPQVTKQGGVTLEGGAKTAGFLASLDALEKVGGLAWLKKNLPNIGSALSGVSTPDAGTEVASAPGATFDINDMNMDTPAAAQTAQTAQNSGGDVQDTVVPSYGTEDYAYDSAPEFTYEPVPDTNVGSFGDQVDEIENPVFEFADGGTVKKQGGANIGQQSNVVKDPRSGLIGGGTGFNAPTPAVGATVGSNTPATAPSTTAVSPAQSSGSISSYVSDSVGRDMSTADGPSFGDRMNSITSKQVSDASGNVSKFAGMVGSKSLGALGALGSFASSSGVQNASTIAGKVVDGTAGRREVGAISDSAGKLASLTQNSALSGAAQIGSVVSQPTLAKAGEAVANIATKGVYNKLKSVVGAVTDGTFTSTVNAVAAFNPALAAINAVAGVADVPSLGEYAGRIAAGFNPASSLTLGDVFSVNEATSNSDVYAGVANDVAAETGADTLDTLMDVTGAFGTAPTGEFDGGGGGYSGDSDSRSDSSSDAGNDSGGNASSEGGSDHSSTAATGGTISGPGTGTSDSIPVRVSDGEVVVTAQTSKKAKEMFGVDFFHNLEKMFNAPAAQAQVRKGNAV